MPYNDDSDISEMLVWKCSVGSSDSKWSHSWNVGVQCEWSLM